METNDLLATELRRPDVPELAPRIKLLADLMPDWIGTVQRWQARAREYSDRFVRPRALAIDRACHRDPRYFDWDLLRESTRYGLLSMLVPKGAGGGGQLTTTLAIVMEELCAACAGVANVIGANGLGLSGILLGLDLYHIDRAMSELVEGDRRREPVLFAAAITEPLAGSDVEDAGYLERARLMTEARPVRGGYLLNGRKVFISNGSVARYTSVIAPLDRSRPLETMSAFLLRQGTPGFSVGRVEQKMGMKACPAAELIFEDCFVPRSERIGAEGEAMRMIEIILGASRGPVGAIATGIARGAFERVVAWAKRRKAGGRRLFDQQWVQIKLAEMARKIHLCRQVYLDACMSFDFLGVPRLMRHPLTRIVLDVVPQRIRRHPLFVTAMRSRASQGIFLRMIDRHLDPDDQRQIQRCSSMAKITGSDVAVEVAAEALQIVGLEGALHRWELEKIFRDAKLTQIYEGTNQLNRHNIFINLFPEERASAYR